MRSESDLPKRLTTQISFYESRAQTSWRIHMTVRISQIVLSSSLPPLSYFIPNAQSLRGIGIVIGSAIAGIEAFRQLWNADQHWRRWRLAAEELKRERALYVESAGDYAGDDAEARRKFIVAIEDIIKNERGEWNKLEESASRTKPIPPTHPAQQGTGQ